jgi:hypothetical protein
MGPLGGRVRRNHATVAPFPYHQCKCRHGCCCTG